MRVLVTDGDNRASLAITRSLGRAGHEVLVGDKRHSSLAGSSRYCADRVLYPDPAYASEDFVAELADIVRSRKVDVLLPVADITTFLVTRNRTRFDAFCRLPFADADVIERAADKVALVSMAQRLNIPVPRYVVVSSPDAIPATDFGFPIVIKPWRSRISTPEGWVSAGVSYVKDRVALVRDLRSRPTHDFPVMLQERIEGPGVGIFACYKAGRPVALFSHRRLRERPPWGGVSVLCESTELCPQARDFAVRLLDSLGWQGVAMVEFKRDRRDSVPRLMEINGRFWGSLQLAIDAGVDFPKILVDDGADSEPAPEYRIGVRSRWLWGDFDSLLLTLFGGARAPEGAREGRLRALGQFLRFGGHNLHYENPRWDDLRPWAFETYRWFRRAAGERTAAPAADRAAADDARSHAATPLRSLRAKVVTSLGEVGLTAGEWNDLAAQSATKSVFQTYEWTQSWLNIFQEQHQPMFVVVSDAGRARAVAPFVMERRLTENVLRFVGDGRADYCDFVNSSRQGEALDSIVAALGEDRRWDLIELNSIPSQSETPQALRRICARHGYRVLCDQQYLCPTLLIAGHEREAFEVFNKPSLRRRQNYYQRAGQLAFRDLTREQDIAPYLEMFFAQHVARWSDTPKQSLFLNGANRLFYAELTRALSETGWLLFSVVEFDGQPIAFHYGFDYGDVVIWYKPSFDPKHQQHSPGMVMVRHLIDYAIGHKRRELDFTVGDEPFKRRFTNLMRHTERVLIFRDPARHALEVSKRLVVSLARKVRG